METTKHSKVLNFLTTTKAMLLGIVAGILLGTFFKPLSLYFAPLANCYFSLITMCILPIIFTSIIISISDLLKTSSPKVLWKIFIVFIMGIFMVSIVCVICALIFKPTLKMDNQSVNNLAAIENIFTEYPSEKLQEKENPKLAGFLDIITPDNVFSALVEGIGIKAVLIAILIGIALGRVKKEKASSFLDLMKATNEVFNMIFKWMIYLLPIALCFIFTSSASSLNITALKTSLQIVGLIYLIGTILFAIYLAVICVSIKKSVFTTLRILKEPIMLGLFAASHIIPIPSTISVFKKHTNLNNRLVELIVPLLAIINHHGKILLLAVVTIFVARFYGIDLGTPQLILALFTASLLGAFAVGQGMLLAPIFIIIAKTLGIPPDMGILFLVAISPFTGNWQSLITVFGNFSLTAILAKETV